MKSDPTIKYIRFELANLIDANEPDSDNTKTGQRAFVGYHNKKKEIKSFVSHEYCPFCGEKY